MPTKTEWNMNENQLRFINTLKEYPNGITLFELKLEKGIEFKTGSINTLITKGYVITEEEERAFACDIVYNGVVVGHTTKKGKVYKLVK